MIVYEFRMFIEKCVVVFVSFNDKKGVFIYVSWYVKIFWYVVN